MTVLYDDAGMSGKTTVYKRLITKKGPKNTYQQAS